MRSIAPTLFALLLTLGLARADAGEATNSATAQPSGSPTSTASTTPMPRPSDAASAGVGSGQKEPTPIEKIDVPGSIPILVPAGPAKTEFQSVFMLKMPDELVGKALTLTDHAIGAQDGTAARVSFALQPGSTDQSKNRFYVTTVKVAASGFGTLARKMELRAEGQQVRFVDYSIAETGTAAGRFTPLGVPAELTWEDAKKGIFVKFDVQSSQVTGLALAGKEFQDESSKKLFDQPLKLCETANPDCAPISILQGAGIHKLYLVPGQNDPDPGSYKAEIVFRADGATSTTAVPMTINVTYPCAKLFGFAVLASGVGLAFILSQLLPNQAARLDALRPLAILSDRVDELIAKAKQYPLAKAKMPKYQAQLKRVALDRTETRYDRVGGFMGMVNRFFTGTNSDPALIKSYLDGLGARINAIDMLTEHGLARIEPVFGDGRQGVKELLDAAIEALDALLNSFPTVPTDFSTQVDTITTKLDKDLAKVPAQMGMAPVPMASAPEKLTLARVDYELRKLNGLGWAIWTLLTVIIGTWILVISKSAFGSAQDYFFCLLWGFGFPTANTTLSALTPGTIRSTLQMPAK